MALSLAGAELLALFLESIFFGAFVVLAIIVTVTVLNWKDRKRPVGLTLAILLLMMLSATTYLAIDFARAFNAFVIHHSADTYYGDLANRLFIAKCAMILTQLSLGASVNIWRLFLISDWSLLVIIPPILSLLTTISVGIFMMDKLAQSMPKSAIRSWLLTYVALDVSGNIYCTAGILLSICRQSSREYLFNSLLPVVRIMIESSAIYTANLTAYLIMFFANSNGQWPAVDISIPLVGILYCLIILQARLRKTSQSIHMQSLHLDLPPHRGDGACSGHSLQSISFTVSPLAIETARPEVEQHEVGSKDVR